MTNPKADIIKTFEQVDIMGIWDEATPWTPEDYAESLELVEKVQDLQKLVNQCEDHELYKKLTLEDLMRVPFYRAKEVIMVLSLLKRITLLDDLSRRRESLYEQIKRYGAKLPKDQQLSNKDYIKIMNRIKHLEILQGWLYGIN